VLRKSGARLFGIVGATALCLSWLAIFISPRILPASWVPNVWAMVLLVALPAGTVACAIAAIKVSHWWYVAVVLGAVSLVVVIASLAV